ncbi:glial fibrillary acidic protein-like isoform X2 [Struthio camelus]|uniref:glial fibrillary acidic protein-like isoform X2 n=1 Tax=Struthio camelus TaxID=8801 RepID=UPI003603D824
MHLPEGMRGWKKFAALAGGMAMMALVVALTLAYCLPAAGQEPAQCQGCMGNGTLAQLEEAQRAKWGEVMAQVAVLQSELGSVKQSLEEARGRWNSCREHLGTLQRDVRALEQAMEHLQRQESEQGARTATLQEENRKLKEDLVQHRQQLEDAKNNRSSLQSQIWNLLRQLQVLQSRMSSANQLAASSLAEHPSLLALAVAGMLFL